MKEEKINPADYGYRDNAAITGVTGKLFNNITMFLEVLGREKGFEMGYELKETMEETASSDNKPKEYLTPIGLTALKLSQIFDEIHIENIRNGIAVHKDELVAEQPFVSPIGQA